MGKRSVVILVLLFCCFTPLFAQQKINGIVTDDKKHLLVGAIVSCSSNGATTMTQQDGSFQITLQHLPDTLIVSLAGFKSQYYPVLQRAELHIAMHSYDGALNEVVITSKQAEGQLMKIDLDKTPANTAQDLLRKVPGLFIAQHAGGGKAEQIFLRGFDNDHGTDIAISADDIPVNMPSHAHGQGYSDLHFLIPETIESIDFGKGSYYADKGDFNTSGYVTFHTFDAVSNSMVKIEGGSFNTARIMGVVNLLHKDSAQRNAYIAGEYNYTDGPFHVKQDFGRLNLFGKYNQNVGRFGRFNVQASVFNSSWNASGQIPERAVSEGLIDRFGSIDTTEGGSTSRINVSASYTYRPNSREEWKSSFYYSHYVFNLYSNFTFYLVHPDLGDEIRQYDNRDVYGMNHSYTQHFFFNHYKLDWTSGIGGRFDDIHDLELSYVTARNTLNERLAWGKAQEGNLNAYTSAELTSGRWRIYGGVRADWFYFNYYDKLQPDYNSTSYNKARVSPKFSVFYNLSDNVSLYVKTGLGFHSNDVRDVVLQQGADILPHSAGADLGAAIKPAKGLIIRPILWYTYMSSEYVWNGDEYGVSDVGATRRFGADFSVRYQPFPFLYFDADLNWAVPRLIDAPKGDNYVELAPTLTSTGGIGVQTKNGFTFNLRYRYMHDRPATQDNSVVAKGYFVNDFLAAYRWRKWELSMQVQNLFNVQWNEAMFAETTRLKGEPAAGVEDLTFTPGTPFFLKGGLTYCF
ncbi:TonB-dependent receptor [Taibaiella soli]|uniref:TonB-dependent receptor n=1 Tax=Taibaiella soli TaxID=1649169 RepID=UPI001A9FF231|nr:TonB-dependent receptor [Taibaiella soli]